MPDAIGPKVVDKARAFVELRDRLRDGTGPVWLNPEERALARLPRGSCRGSTWPRTIRR